MFVLKEKNTHDCCLKISVDILYEKQNISYAITYRQGKIVMNQTNSYHIFVLLILWVVYIFLHNCTYVTIIYQPIHYLQVFTLIFCIEYAGTILPTFFSSMFRKKAKGIKKIDIKIENRTDDKRV